MIRLSLEMRQDNYRNRRRNEDCSKDLAKAGVAREVTLDFNSFLHRWLQPVIQENGEDKLQVIKPDEICVCRWNTGGNERKIMAEQGSTGNVIAALASFFIPGLGQLIQGRMIKAGIMFVLAGVIWFISLGTMGWVIHLWSIIDAARYRAGE